MRQGHLLCSTESLGSVVSDEAQEQHCKKHFQLGSLQLPAAWVGAAASGGKRTSACVCMQIARQATACGPHCRRPPGLVPAGTCWPNCQRCQSSRSWACQQQQLMMMLPGQSVDWARLQKQQL